MLRLPAASLRCAALHDHIRSQNPSVLCLRCRTHTSLLRRSVIALTPSSVHRARRSSFTVRRCAQNYRSVVICTHMRPGLFGNGSRSWTTSSSYTFCSRLLIIIAFFTFTSLYHVNIACTSTPYFRRIPPAIHRPHPLSQIDIAPVQFLPLHLGLIVFLAYMDLAFTHCPDFAGRVGCGVSCCRRYRCSNELKSPLYYLDYYTYMPHALHAKYGQWQ